MAESDIKGVHLTDGDEATSSATPTKISVAMTTLVNRRQHESELGKEPKRVQVNGCRSENIDVEEHTHVSSRFMLFIQTLKYAIPWQLAIRNLISTWADSTLKQCLELTSEIITYVLSSRDRYWPQYL